MAGTLTIGTLSDGTNSTSSTDAIKGSAKAWCTFVGATGVVSTSYNVSSVTRVGTGNWTVNLTNALADVNGCAITAIKDTATWNLDVEAVINSTTAIYVRSYTSAGALYDCPAVAMAVFR